MQWVGRAGVCACVGFTFASNIAQLWICEGDSMAPTLTNNDIVIAAPFVPDPFFPLSFFRKPSVINRGDIIVLKHPLAPQTSICKRVIGNDLKEITVSKSRLAILHH